VAQAFTGTAKSESGRTEFAGSSVTAAAAARIDHDQGTGSQPLPLRLTRITAPSESKSEASVGPASESAAAAAAGRGAVTVLALETGRRPVTVTVTAGGPALWPENSSASARHSARPLTHTVTTSVNTPRLSEPGVSDDLAQGKTRKLH
jgi:hypothetical protein